MGHTWYRSCTSKCGISVVWKHFKQNLNIKANNTLDINDIMSMETKVVSLPVTNDTVIGVAA